jgi:hypothetical protein
VLSRLALIGCLSLPLLLAEAAGARPFCEEDRPDSEAEAPDPAERAERERIILPCVLAEMGHSCTDATVYVLTTAGVLLCQFDIPVLAVGAGLPQVERANASVSGITSLSMVALPVDAARLPPLLAVDLSVAPPRLAAAPRDGYDRLSSPPS